MRKKAWLICVVYMLSVAYLLGGTIATAQSATTIYGADANPTGEPLGGGEGYSKLVLTGDYIVENKEQFLAALAKARPGQVIYIEPHAEINMTGYVNFDIPGGITIAGNRGYQGSPGPLIYNNQLETYPCMWRLTGPGVRITGIRVRGPHYQLPNSLGINVLADNVEIDNCEIYDWSYAGIHIMRAHNVYIHHNYIHHVQRPGLGYPVTLNRATAIIEANIFDYYRHAIAASGHAGTGYEARYNLVKANAINHAFDMHGGTDFCANQSAPCTQQEIIMAGAYVNIHHNTFEITAWDAIRVRGIPTDYVEVHSNWFLNNNEIKSCQFRYYRGGNAHVYNNVYGKNQRLVAELIKPSPFVFLEGSNVIYALADGGRIMYGFANPSQETGQVVRGNLAVELLPVQVDEVLGRPFVIRQVEIRLNNSTLLYSGEALPKPGEVIVDTLSLKDGVHQLSLKISGNLDIPLEKTVSFMVDNYWEMEDDLDAPSESSWFGVIDHSRTSDKSDGWSYAIGDQDTFYDDDSRIIRTQLTPEYLTWEVPLVKEFIVTAYAKSKVPSGVFLWVSTDGEQWQQVSYQVQASEANEHGWYRLELIGSTPIAKETNWFRLSIDGDADPAGLQIGQVYFLGQSCE